MGRKLLDLDWMVRNSVLEIDLKTGAFSDDGKTAETVTG